MNPLRVAATSAIQDGWLLGANTILFVTIFAIALWWALRPANRARFELEANLPFDDGEGPGGTP